MPHIAGAVTYTKNWISRHKITAAAVVIAIAVGAYYGYSAFFGNTNSVRYVSAAAERGALIVSVSSSGQVSASNQIDIKSKVSGDVIYVGVKSGQQVAAGALLIRLDDGDAQKSVRDAEINLESAKLSFEKLKQSSADVSKIKEDAFNDISNTFLDLPAAISGSEIIINGSTLNSSQSNYGFYKDFVYERDKDEAALFVNAAKNDFNTARAKYDATLLVYKNTSRYADSDTISILLDQTIDATKAVAQALKSEQSMLDYLTDYVSTHKEKVLPLLIGTYRSNVQTYIGQTNGHLVSLLGTQNTIKNAPLDIGSQELSVKQRENALADAREKLADYYIRAPFSGIVAKIDVKAGDSISAGSVGTFIAKQKIAEISFNEVDIAKVKTGQKATLTFDAIPELSIAGEVAEIDTIGTVTQGVVNYAVKISFGTQDDRVKPGMSVAASIITDMKPDVILVPNSAVKQEGNEAYAEIFTGENQTPNRQAVQTGLSNDTMTEIISGLNENDKVVTQTVAAGNTTSAQTGTTQNGGIRIPGLGGFR